MAIIESDLMDVVRDHMDAQPYVLTCSECGEDLRPYSSVSQDNDLDLLIEVGRCKCSIAKE